MNGNERRLKIASKLNSASQALSGTFLSNEFSVSRQIIVQDIAKLKLAGFDIISTNKGYRLQSSPMKSRVIKVHHLDEQIEEELNLIVDLGGRVKDVFIKHKTYGEIRAPLDIDSRYDVQQFLQDIYSGKSSPLKNITANYHYHTIEAQNESTLSLIEKELEKKNFTASLLDYE